MITYSHDPNGMHYLKVSNAMVRETKEVLVDYVWVDLDTNGNLVGVQVYSPDEEEKPCPLTKRLSGTALAVASLSTGH